MIIHDVEIMKNLKIAEYTLLDAISEEDPVKRENICGKYSHYICNIENVAKKHLNIEQYDIFFNMLLIVVITGDSLSFKTEKDVRQNIVSSMNDMLRLIVKLYKCFKDENKRKNK